MILAKLSDANDYRGINARLDMVLDRLNPEFLNNVGLETQWLDNELLYVTRFDYETMLVEDGVFEAHKKYLDVHLVLSGHERIDIADPKGLSLVESKDDFFAYHGQEEQTVILRPGNFLVVFPSDAHRIKMPVNYPESVSKVVFKIYIDDLVSKEGKI